MTDYELYDFRYPFSSLLDFFGGIYFLKIEALHLTFGYFFLVFLIYKVLSNNKLDWSYKISILYFSGTIFNNYAFTLGITIAEMFGILAVIIFIRQKINLNIISTYMIIFATFSLLHYLALLVFNETILFNYEFKHIALILKIFVLAINISILFRFILSKKDIEIFVRYIMFAINIAGLAYFIQIIVFLFGFIPYGSFSPAGWAESIIPSFGSVSIERGHFGKFLVPLFPLVLYAYKAFNYKKSLILFLLTSFLNLSASSYVFIILYLFFSIVFLRDEIGTKRILMLLAIVTSVLLFYSSQIVILFNKVYEAGILQNEGGDRSFSVLWDMLAIYPYGFGYGGSSYRYLPGVYGIEFNNPIASYFGQLSFFGLFILLIFFYLLYKGYKISNYLKVNYGLERKILLISIIMLCIIFAVDILWFVPTIWLPIVIFFIFANLEKRRMLIDTHKLQH